MSRYTIVSKPEFARPITSAGDWRNEPVVLSLQTRVKLIVRPPAGSGGPGDDTEADEFEAALRQAVAGTLLYVESGDYTVVGVVVEQFEDAGG